jgi:hypothetical protein
MQVNKDLLTTRTPLEDQRLQRLIAFLRDIDEQRFDYACIAHGDSHVEGRKCPTVACAAGWLPSVFPDELVWKDNFMGFVDDVAFKDMTWKPAFCTWHQVVEEFLGVPLQLFLPDHDDPRKPSTRVDERLPFTDQDATAKEVADMFEAYRTLYPVQPELELE